MVSGIEDPRATVEQLFVLYEQHGHAEYSGEPVSQLAHMWQTAALAAAEGYEEEVVLAAFFHDLGHLCACQEEVATMGSFGAVDHEKLGADYLRACGFSERLARLVESHVIAKRYLTHKYPEYLQQLSPASHTTLIFQGGPMTATEAAIFEQNPDANLIIRLREWDDRAKREDLPTGDLASFKAMALRHLLAQAS